MPKKKNTVLYNKQSQKANATKLTCLLLFFFNCTVLPCKQQKTSILVCTCAQEERCTLIKKIKKLKNYTQNEVRTLGMIP